MPEVGDKEKFLEMLADPNVELSDEQLLEIMFSSCVPRKNLDKVRILLDSYPNLSTVLTTDPATLVSVHHIDLQTASFLRVVGAIMQRLAQSGRIGKLEDPFPITELRSHVKEKLSSLSYEVLLLYGVDEKNDVTYAMGYTSGASNHVKVWGEEVMRFLSEFHPHGVVLSHNHPNTLCKPSGKDTEFTKMAHMVCHLNGVNLIDHMIVGRNGVFSYEASGLLDAIKEQCDMDKLLGAPLPDPPGFV